MDKINLSSSFLCETPKFKGTESNLYIYDDKLLKILTNTDVTVIKNKIEKVEILSEIKEDIIKPTDLVYIDNKIAGYAMDYKRDYHDIEGCSLSIKKKRKIEILKDVLNQLEIFHKYGIIYGDIHFGNILVSKDKPSYLCDIDNVKIGKHGFDVTNTNQKDYLKRIKDIDEYMDNYVFNVIVAALLYNYTESDAIDYLVDHPRKFKKYNDDYESIIYAMDFLKEQTKDNIKPLIKK